MSLYDYTHNSLRLRSALSRQYSKALAVSVHGYVSTDTASSDTLTAAELGPDSYSQMALGGTVSYDRRDSPILPRKGWMTSLSLEAGMADISYLRTDFRLSYYLPITDNFRFAAKLPPKPKWQDSKAHGCPVIFKVRGEWPLPFSASDRFGSKAADQNIAIDLKEIPLSRLQNSFNSTELDRLKCSAPP